MELRQNNTTPGTHSVNFISGTYQIQSHKLSDDYLDVYVVTDTAGAQFEAQAFTPIAEMPREREGLCQARRRRMKRICRSPNFEGELEHNGRRFLLSRVQRSDKEWVNLQAQVGGLVKSENMPLPIEACDKNTRVWADGFVAKGQVMPEPHKRSSYAEAVARNAEYSEDLDLPTGRQKVCFSPSGSKEAKRQNMRW
ncbi:hypothetical protein EsH8_V_000330 [Colletotrichum jinshuiense]